MTEAELAEKFILLFDGFEIFQEVPVAGRVADFVSRDGKIVTAVEVKKSLNWDVINQAYENTKHFHYSYIAVPIPKSIHPVQKDILKKYGIGLLTYKELKSAKLEVNTGRPIRHVSVSTGHVEEWIAPAMFRKVKVPELMDFMKSNIAGTQNGRMTPFGYFVRCVKQILLMESKPLPYTKVFECLEYRYYPKLTAFKSNIYQYIRAGIIKGIVWDYGGLLSLTPEERDLIKGERFKYLQNNSFIVETKEL